jgi:hypothetical protein
MSETTGIAIRVAHILDLAGGTLGCFRKATITHADLTANANYQEIDAFTLAPGEVIDRFLFQHSEAFVGGALTGMQASLILPDTTEISEQTDVFAAPSSGIDRCASLLTNYGPNFGDLTTTRTVKVILSASGDIVGAASAGSLILLVEVLQLS